MISKLIGKTIVAGAVLGCIILTPDVFGQASRSKGIRVFSGPKNQAGAVQHGMNAMKGRGFGMIHDAAQPCFIDIDGDGVCDRLGMMRHGGMGGRMGGCMGMGRGFVDADNDGINDNSPLAQLNLTDEQKQQIAALRESGPGPHFEALKAILTEEQLAQLQTLRPFGAGRGFVDADNDGINDNSPLAQLNLTDEQKQKIIALRESGPGPHFEALKSILTEEQLAQLQTLRPFGAGRGFVDADNDGINDNSPLAQLNLTDEQKQQIIALRESGPGPHFAELANILTKEQLEQLETLVVQGRAEHQANRPGIGLRPGRAGRGMGFGGWR
ncbi:MAG: hypothetical protein AB1656_13215 [Candidatus Omnitrophota bacterium]